MHDAGEVFVKHSPAYRLRQLLARPGMIVMPCCFDAMSARLIELSGFPLTFMSGFAVSAARLALPDTGLISYGEMVEQARNICAAVSIPVIGDGDTGYGNAMNVRRTVEGYARAGLACVMIEDQVAPKRCGHTAGKSVVSRADALQRLRAALDVRDEGTDILILARTDARATEGLGEALWRAEAFADAGADIVFLEAPRSQGEMEEFCRRVPVPKLANVLEGGASPSVPLPLLEQIGYKIAAFPLTLLNVALGAMLDALRQMASGQQPVVTLSFEQVKNLVGFDRYYEDEERYRGPQGD